MHDSEGSGAVFIYIRAAYDLMFKQMLENSFMIQQMI